MEGVGKPHSYGKFQIFDDEADALTWDAAEKNAHAHLRRMGIPIPEQENAASIPSGEPQRQPKEKTTDPPAPRVHTKLGEGVSSIPPLSFDLAEKVDHKLEAIARAHILLHFLRDTCCKEHPQHAGWINEILETAPQK